MLDEKKALKQTVTPIQAISVLSFVFKLTIYAKM